ncbi:MAG: ABC transporter ATP-binding protein/permease [Acholeplasmatales bacterium]|jgi:ABC-type lipoprotein export system ATPase subunit|nr:ABC transporter ATP-binding protein/permease [Acholeplasmatales bacterium]
MLTLHNVRKVYISKTKQEVVALDNISFELPNTGLVFIVGKSGSGKSTMLNILGGLDSVTSGSVILNEVGELSEKNILDAYRNTCLGFVFQEFHLLDTLTVYDNIALALEMKGEKVEKKLIEEALIKVDLAGLTNRYPEELSGGQKQRVAIARAIIKNPSIILADEPTGNLDSTTSKEILQLLRNLSKEKLVVVVTHDKEEARKFGNRIIELRDGKVLTDNIIKISKDIKVNSTVPVLKNAKFTFSSILKFVLSALKHKKIKLISSIILSVIAIVMFGVAFLLSTYSTEKQISKDVKDSKNNYFVISPIPDPRDTSLKAINIIGGMQEFYDPLKGVPSTMVDYISNFYPNINTLEVYRGYWLRVPYDELAGNAEYTAVIKNTNDIKNTIGFDLLPGFIPVEYGNIYLSDVLVRILTSSLVVAKIDGEDLVVNSYYVIEDNGDEIDLIQYTSLGDLVGKELWQRNDGNAEDTLVAKIGGIINMDYDKLSSTYSSMNQYDKAVANYNIQVLYSFIFCDFQTYKDRFKPTSEYNIDYKYGYDKSNAWKTSNHDIFIQTGNFTIKQDGLTIRLGGNSYSSNGVPTLNEGEVVLTVDLYNRLFDENIKVSGGILLSSPKHIGEKITVKVNDVSGRVIGTIFECTLINVVKNASLSGDIIYTSQHEFDTLSDASYNAEALIGSLSTISEINAFLKDMRGQNYYAYTPFSVELYRFELSFNTFSLIFWGAAGILALFSILLIMSFISNGVTSKKKEIGILRALGARVSDTEKIFMMESFFIATAIALLAIIFLFGAFIGISNYLSSGKLSNVSVLSFNFLSIPIIIAFSYIITVLSTIIPVYKISKMKPTDAIKKVA